MLSQKTSGGLSQNDSSNSRKAPGYLNWKADVGIDDIPLRYRMDCLCWKCHQIPKERTREIKLSFPFFLRLQHGRWGAGLHSETSLPWPWRIQSQSGSEFSLYLVIAWDLGKKKKGSTREKIVVLPLALLFFPRCKAWTFGEVVYLIQQKGSFTEKSIKHIKPLQNLTAQNSA